ncbi:trypsin-like serine peptidase [Jidongwangia harbinensis]|uniref:trypsin-like serine peptidase n=1 Tax=Jidongwangia harbinensis TaxID=2878561 RepID=UPI001CD97FB5|nr:serine protease [Jidongwangia harbinensis]MCA2213618.1 serine protease [Jidongwangia harbinensis]
MRRKVGIVVGVCAALALAGSAGAAARTYTSDEGRPVGTWHEAPGVARTPVAVAKVQPAPAAGPETKTTARPAPTASAPRAVRTERATNGRQRVGELLDVKTVLGYAGKAHRQTFRYPGASYVKLHLNRMLLLPGDYLTVSDPAGQESYRYDAPKPIGTGAVDKWTMSITGDTAVLELHRGGGSAAGVLLGSLGVHVDRVARGFTRTEQSRAPEPAAPGRTGREESVCGGDQSADAICYRSTAPVAYTRSKAVARLLINGVELCTGWRVGEKNRMLTNNHCFTTSADAYDTEVWFNYQCTRCGGYQVFRPTKVWGDRVLATNRIYDYTVFTVENFPLVRKFGHLNLDPVRPVKGQQLYVPQHPAGEPVRIAGALGDRAGNCAVVDNAYDGYARDTDVSYFCDTEGGSSGSPVLSRKTNRVVALHHFGGCPNSGVRADILVNKLKAVL